MGKPRNSCRGTPFSTAPYETGASSSRPAQFYVYSPLPPVVTLAIPAGEYRGGTTPIRLIGQNLDGGTVMFDGTGLSTALDQSTGSLNVTVAADAPIGHQTMTVSTPSGSTTMCGGATCTFQVTDSGTWTDLANSPFDTQFYFPGYVIVLLNNQVLVAGGSVGQRPPQVPSASAWIFDPSSGNWKPASPMLKASLNGGASLLPDGRVLVAASDGLEIYDPVKDSWSNVSSQSGGKLLLLPTGKVFVDQSTIGTFSGGIFDPVTGRLQSASGTPMTVHGLTTLTELLPDGRILLINGASDNSVYDPMTGSFSTMPAMTTMGGGWTRLLPDGRVLVRLYVVLGPFTPNVTTFLYDPVTNSVSQPPSPNNGCCGIFSLNGEDVLLPSGSLLINGTDIISRPGLYDASRDQIFPEVPPPTAAYRNVLLSDGRVFGLGLSNGGGSIPRIYMPAAFQNPAPVIGYVHSTVPMSGTDTLSLEVYGSSFLPNSSVFIGQTKLVTLYLGATHLVALVPPAVQSSLSSGITVNNPAPGGGTTPTIRVNVSATVPLPIADVETGPIRSGYVVVTPDANSGTAVATLTYGIVRDAIVQSQAATLPTPATTNTSIMVDVVPGIGRNLGIAIANAADSSALITLTLHDETGATISNASFPLTPQAQLARFITELFSADVIGAAFRGSLGIQSSIPVSIVALRFSGQEFSTVPIPTSVGVNPVGNPMVFPQFAMSGGWATTLNLLNTTSTVISGRIDIFDTSGKPMAVTLNGTQKSTFTYSIPPQGSILFAPRDSNGQSPF